jgi:hypothetical protein
MATQSVSSILDRLFADMPIPAMIAPRAHVAPPAVIVARPAVASPVTITSPVVTAPRVAMVPVKGNTYPVKETLKTLGARWDKDAKTWLVPADKLEAAQTIVAGAPKKEWTKVDSIAAAGRKRGETPGRCSDCGIACKYPYTQCWDCRQDLR